MLNEDPLKNFSTGKIESHPVGLGLKGQWKQRYLQTRTHNSPLKNLPGNVG